MFDIPVELFALGCALSLVFVVVGLVTRKNGTGYVIAMTAGLFIMVFSLASDNIVMGYDGDKSITYNNVTKTITEASNPEPINYEYTEMVKILFTAIGAFSMFGCMVLLIRDD